MTQYVQENVAKLERPIVAWALLGLIFGLLCVYAYFVNGAVANIVAAKDMRAEVSSLTSAVSTLESEYLSAKSTLDLELAYTLGLSSTNANALYIAKKSEQSLSFNR